VKTREQSREKLHTQFWRNLYCSLQYSTSLSTYRTHLYAYPFSYLHLNSHLHCYIPHPASILALPYSPTGYTGRLKFFPLTPDPKASASALSRSPTSLFRPLQHTIWYPPPIRNWLAPYLLHPRCGRAHYTCTVILISLLPNVLRM